MEILHICPLRATSLLWQERARGYARAVIVRVAFELAPVESRLASEQEAPNEDDNHWDDDLARSLFAPSDLVPAKAAADVMLVGSAYAPGGAPVRSLVARMVVGEVDKSLTVHGDRFFRQDGTLQEAAPFARMRLLYERARGGPGTANPVGIREGARDTYGRVALPNLEPAGLHVTSPDDAIETIGFGPLSPAWQLRAERLGPNPAPRVERGRTLTLPEGFDLAYFNSAPRDQRVSALRDNERIVLEHLHPSHPRLVTSLPGVRPAVFVEGRRGPESLPMRADTLWIDTDRGVAALVFRGQIPIERPDDDGRVIVAMERGAQRLAWADVEAKVPMKRRKQAHPTLTMLHSAEDPTTAGPTSASSRTLPFLGQELPSAPRPEAAPRADGALPFQTKSALSQSSASWGQPIAIARSPEPPPLPPTPPRAPPPLPLSATPRVEPAPLPPAPPPVPVEPPADARALGLLAASNLAADRWPAKPGAAPDARSEATPGGGREVIELLFHDPELGGRLRRVEPWRLLLEALEEKPADRDLEEPAGGEAASVEDRREVYEVLVEGQAGGSEAVYDALERAIRRDGKIAPRLALFHGELLFPFDELERLRALASVAAPFATTDEGLKAALEDARAYATTPAESASGALADSLATRLREAFGAASRSVPATYLDDQAERALLTHRHYQKRKLFGGPQLRALATLAGEEAPVPTYLPADVGEKLPLYQRLRARFIAEVSPAVDQYETHTAALRVLALARVTFVGRR